MKWIAKNKNKKIKNLLGSENSKMAWCEVQENGQKPYWIDPHWNHKT